jgi:hypothetical protein
MGGFLSLELYQIAGLKSLSTIIFVFCHRAVTSKVLM